MITDHATHLLLVHTRRATVDASTAVLADTAHLWVDPDLEVPGPPQAEYRAAGPLDALGDLRQLQFKASNGRSARYVVDEIRIGLNWSDVLPWQEHLACDFNADNAVDAADAAIMFGQWGGPGTADCFPDGIVDAADAGLMFTSWTGDGVQRSVPEPVMFRSLATIIVSLGRLLYGGVSTGRRSRIRACGRSGAVGTG